MVAHLIYFQPEKNIFIRFSLKKLGGRFTYIHFSLRSPRLQQLIYLFFKSAYNFGSGTTFKTFGLRRVIKSLRTLGLAVGLIYVHNRDSTGIEL